MMVFPHVFDEMYESFIGYINGYDDAKIEAISRAFCSIFCDEDTIEFVNGKTYSRSELVGVISKYNMYCNTLIDNDDSSMAIVTASYNWRTIISTAYALSIYNQTPII